MLNVRPVAVCLGFASRSRSILEIEEIARVATQALYDKQADDENRDSTSSFGCSTDFHAVGLLYLRNARSVPSGLESEPLSQ